MPNIGKYLDNPERCVWNVSAKRTDVISLYEDMLQKCSERMWFHGLFALGFSKRVWATEFHVCCMLFSVNRDQNTIIFPTEFVKKWIFARIPLYVATSKIEILLVKLKWSVLIVSHPCIRLIYHEHRTCVKITTELLPAKSRITQNNHKISTTTCRKWIPMQHETDGLSINNGKEFFFCIRSWFVRRRSFDRCVY